MSINRVSKRINFSLDLDGVQFSCFLDPVSRKNLNVTIKPNNEIWLSKPRNLDDDVMRQYLHSNSEWIVERSNKVNEVFEKRNSYITDDYVVVFGEKIYFKDNPNILAESEHLLFDYVTKYRNQFDELFQKQPTIEIVEMKGRWGACSPAVESILLNKKLVHYPKSCINYVMAHECLHLLIPNHSPEFYKAMEEILPNYRDCIEYMKAN